MKNSTLPQRAPNRRPVVQSDPRCDGVHAKDMPPMLELKQDKEASYIVLDSYDDIGASLPAAYDREGLRLLGFSCYGNVELTKFVHRILIVSAKTRGYIKHFESLAVDHAGSAPVARHPSTNVAEMWAAVE